MDEWTHNSVLNGWMICNSVADRYMDSQFYSGWMDRFEINSAVCKIKLPTLLHSKRVYFLFMKFLCGKQVSDHSFLTLLWEHSLYYLLLSIMPACHAIQTVAISLPQMLTLSSLIHNPLTAVPKGIQTHFNMCHVLSINHSQIKSHQMLSSQCHSSVALYCVQMLLLELELLVLSSWGNKALRWWGQCWGHSWRELLWPDKQSKALILIIDMFIKGCHGWN